MRQLAFLQHKAQRISSLFLLWDSNSSGTLEAEELQLVLAKWSGFSSEEEAQRKSEWNRGQEELTHTCCFSLLVAAVIPSLGLSRKLTRHQFSLVMEGLSAGMDGEKFKEFSDYLQTSVKVWWSWATL